MNQETMFTCHVDKSIQKILQKTFKDYNDLFCSLYFNLLKIILDERNEKKTSTDFIIVSSKSNL